MKERLARLALAFALGATAATFAYAFLRVERIAFHPAEANPALIIWSPHAGFFWRALTAGYFGGAVAFAAWLLASRDPARVARVLPSAVTIAAFAIALQGILVP